VTAAGLGSLAPAEAAIIGWPAHLLSANVSALYRTVPVLDRPAAAVADGFSWMETWWPFAPDETPTSAHIEELGRAVDAAGIQVACVGFSSGKVADGERGLPVLADGYERLVRHVPIALDVAERLGCTLMNLLFGRVAGVGVPRNVVPASAVPAAAALTPDIRRRALDAITFVATTAAKRGIRVMIEPICQAESPGYLASTLVAVTAVCDEVEAACSVPVGICGDIYHLYPSEDDLAAAMRTAAPRFLHVQVSDWPGRCPPGSGQIDIAAAVTGLAAGGYRGLVGLEYFPVDDAGRAR
jgi:hydroxypyruvate isomerase